jgi:hypothetical protein
MKQIRDPGRACLQKETSGCLTFESEGYAQLTPQVKNQMFGLNAARILVVDHESARKAIKTDKLAELRRERRYDPQSRTNVQYGWVWEEDGGAPTVPVGVGQASA